MLEFTTVDKTRDSAATLTATLAYADRQKSRLRFTLDSGEDAGIVLTHGSKLRCGDVLVASSGERLRVAAALEPVSSVTVGDRRALARICYHLGNRHVSLQIGDGWVRYERDHVLDDMIVGLGYTVVHEDAGFEPEQGAYAQHAHGHGHAAHD